MFKYLLLNSARYGKNGFNVYEKTGKQVGIYDQYTNTKDPAKKINYMECCNFST